MLMTVVRLKNILDDYDQANEMPRVHLSILLAKLLYRQVAHLTVLTADDEWILLNCFIGPPIGDDDAFVETYIQCVGQLCGTEQHVSPWRTLQALEALKRTGIYNRDNFELFKKHVRPRVALLAVLELERLMLLNQEHYRLAMQHVDARAIVEALGDLVAIGLLTPVWKAAAHNSPHPLALVAVLKFLQEGALLTPANSALIVAHERPWAIALIFSFLSHAGILRQDTFNLLFLPEHRWLLSHEARVELWDRLPERFFNEQLFREFLHAARTENPAVTVNHSLQALILMIENDLAVEEEPPLAVLNGVDSTHTASVHKTSSESALRLQLRYGHFEPEEQRRLIEQATLWMIGAYGENEKIPVALRAIIRISDLDYTYFDPTSNISLHTLIALVWRAMHDDVKRSGTLADAKQLWLDALYEIQRGGNLSEDGIDDQYAEELFICPAGAFNKFIEKLQGIHADCQIQFITNLTASYKLPCVVYDVAAPCLRALARPLSAMGALGFTQLISSLEQEGVSVLWGFIKNAVSALMFAEFHSLYRDQQDPAFIAFIDAGQDYDIADLYSLQQDLQQSKGYWDYCGVQLKRETRFGATLRLSLRQENVGLQSAHLFKP